MKRKKTTGSALLIPLFAAALILTGCSGQQDTAEREGRMADAPAAKAASPKAGAWPSWIPSDIPKYSYGSVLQAIQQNGGGAIVFMNVNMRKDPFNAYKKDLLAKGWTVDEENENDQTHFLLVSNPRYSLTYTCPRDGEGVSIFFFTQ
jgi:uncharacterized lipoprotein YajG